MIDKNRSEQLAARIAGVEAPKAGLALLSQGELRKLRAEVDRLITGQTLGDLNLESELLEQYAKIKDLMDEVSADGECPANQKAQVANSVVTALGQLVKMQEDLKRQETLKIMEGCLIDAVKTLPELAQAEFFAEYGRLAEKAGLT